MNDLIEQAASDLLESRYAIVLTGAGMSTESGIPDFRGPKGVWSSDREAEARAYERYSLFLRDPVSYWEEVLGRKGTHGAFYSTVRRAEPNPGHYALAELERLGVVKWLITQNIDGLHRRAGSVNVTEYHGTVHKLRCPACGSRRPLEDAAPENLPPHCGCGRAMKYDVVHFNEPIPPDVMSEAEEQALKCDLMLVCGTSAVVYPFADLPRAAKLGRAEVKVIEVNAEPTQLTQEGLSDYHIRGKTGEVLPGIVEALRKRSRGPGSSLPE